jgi:hypothetical protein
MPSGCIYPNHSILDVRFIPQSKFKIDNYRRVPKSYFIYGDDLCTLVVIMTNLSPEQMKIFPRVTMSIFKIVFATPIQSISS